jgi:exosome complex component RRP45
LLDTVVVGSKALDPESLCILSGRFVWKVTVDCLVCIDDGNIIDNIINGAVLSLMDLRKPLVRFDKDKVSYDRYSYPWMRRSSRPSA